MLVQCQLNILPSGQRITMRESVDGVLLMKVTDCNRLVMGRFPNTSAVVYNDIQ